MRYRQKLRRKESEPVATVKLFALDVLVVLVTVCIRLPRIHSGSLVLTF